MKLKNFYFIIIYFFLNIAIIYSQNNNILIIKLETNSDAENLISIEITKKIYDKIKKIPKISIILDNNKTKYFDKMENILYYDFEKKLNLLEDNYNIKFDYIICGLYTKIDTLNLLTIKIYNCKNRFEKILCCDKYINLNVDIIKNIKIYNNFIDEIYNYINKN